MRFSSLIYRIALPLAALLAAPAGVFAQNIVVLVNDEPVTSYDIAQRMRWNARTSNFGERMKAQLTGEAINQEFRKRIIAAQPKSQAEAQQVAEKIKKDLVAEAKSRVLSEGGSTNRKAVIEALIDDKLKLQAAKKLEIKITDKEVEESLAARAGTGADGKKPDMNAFYAQFENDGISRKTIKEIIRVQLAWRDVIRRVYGPRIMSMMAAIPDSTPKVSDADINYDVRVLRLAIKDATDQKAVAARMIEAENLKEKYQSCAELPKQAKLIFDATVKTIDKAKLASFPKDVQPLIEKAVEGQMTPPVQIGNAVESYAVCRKTVPVKTKASTEQKPDPRQAEYERFSRSYLQELRQKASIDYRGS